MRPDLLDLAYVCREAGMSYVETAREFVRRYPGMPALVAHRLARSWSQRDAEREWCKRWPDDPKTFKSFSYWENFGRPTGYHPSLPVLARVAELYECAVSDLVDGFADFRYRDPHYVPPDIPVQVVSDATRENLFACVRTYEDVERNILGVAEYAREQIAGILAKGHMDINAMRRIAVETETSNDI